ncbi:MAG: peptidase M48, partial [Bacteroidetes bacterium QS_1_65_9]
MLMAGALAAGTTGCVSTGTNPVSGDSRVYGYSWEEEQKMGAKSHKQIRAQYGFYDNDEVQQYVDEVGQRVLAESDLRDAGTKQKFRETDFTFTVLDSPIVNAFALPGGYVYVSRGLMSHLNNEAQLAVVLGHEIVHVAARHASAQAGKKQLGQLGLIAAALGTQALGGPGGQVARLGQTATKLLFLEYSRDN